jgi:hypothetical protein
VNGWKSGKIQSMRFDVKGESVTTRRKVSKLTPTKPKPVNGSKLSHQRTVEESADEQKLHQPFDFKKNFGRGAKLWKNDQEFDEFLAWLQKNRKEER